ncbi:MAG TPA: hypothetical protein VFC00_39810 [Micromonosporaceae bacterium]|nr:hypothetical protein [Micromonosporaceae bacterium]
MRVQAIAWTLAIALGAAGCTTPGSIAGTAPSPSPADDRQTWVQCMAEHGAEIVDGKPVGPQDKRLDTGTFERAVAACEQYDTPDDLDRQLTPAEVEQWRRWAQCMRDNGIDMNDPDPNVAGGRPVPRSTDSTMVDVERAMRSCDALAASTAGPTR